METIKIRMLSAGLFFLFIFLTGYWLNHSGKPYPGILFTLHKLIGLGAGIYLFFTVNQLHRAAPLGGVEITVIVVTVLLFIATVAAGGLLSVEKPAPPAISLMHNILPFVCVLSTAASLYLCWKK